jgi:DNA-binding XRE family transcriptional regulator
VMHHERMTRDWKRLGHAIKARREELGMATQQALADAAGVKRQTVQALESGRQRSRMPASIGSIEKALAWEPGTIARILAAGDTPSQNRETGRLAEGMPVRVLKELSSGEVVDTEVIELNIPGSSFKLVGILKQDSPGPEASSQEMATALKEWSRMQRALRQITDDRNGSPDQR